MGQDLKNTLAYQLPDFCAYLDRIGYESADCVNTFFETIAQDPELASQNLWGLIHLLIPMIAKNQEEQKNLTADLYRYFHQEPDEITQKIESRSNHYKNQRDSMKNQMSKNQSAIEKLQKTLNEGMPKKDPLTEKQKKDLEKKQKACGRGFSDVLQGPPEVKKLLKELPSNSLKGKLSYSVKELSLMREALKQAMKKAVSKKNFQEILAFLTALNKVLDLYEKSCESMQNYDQNQRKLERMVRKQEELKRQIDQQQSLFQADVKKIVQENIKKELFLKRKQEEK